MLSTSVSMMKFTSALQTGDQPLPVYENNFFMNPVANLDERLQFFRTCDPNELSRLISTVITDGRLPKGFLHNLNACMICWSVADGACVSREVQLRVILAERHTLVTSGTGRWKDTVHGTHGVARPFSRPSDYNYNFASD